MYKPQKCNTFYQLKFRLQVLPTKNGLGQPMHIAPKKEVKLTTSSYTMFLDGESVCTVRLCSFMIICPSSPIIICNKNLKNMTNENSIWLQNILQDKQLKTVMEWPSMLIIWKATNELSLWQINPSISQSLTHLAEEQVCQEWNWWIFWWYKRVADTQITHYFITLPRSSLSKV